MPLYYIPVRCRKFQVDSDRKFLYSFSRKFYRKVSHINSLKELNEQVKLDTMLIPEAVRRLDLS